MTVSRPGQVVDPDEARRAAQHILDDRRFHRDPAPRPLRGPLQWLGDRLHPVFQWIGDVLSFVPYAVWLALALLIVAAVIARVVVVSRRRRVSTAVGGGRPGTIDAEAHEDASALERAADEAERDGDLERALRLRFRAGLLRLGDRGAITYRPSVTTNEVRRALGSLDFEALAGTFEAVAYGGRTAAPPDLDSARRVWPRVLEEAGSK